MSTESNSETNVNTLNKCPHCQCCFCTEADLKRHLEVMGSSKVEHSERFRNTHGRLEHGGFGGPE